MKGKLLIAAAVMTLAAGVAESATLIGETVYVRFDLGAGYDTAVVGSGAEYSDYASPQGYPWTWTVDFGADSFAISATTTEAIDSGSGFTPTIQFASATPGLIPSDPNKITLTETSVSSSLSSGDFSISATNFGANGIRLKYHDVVSGSSIPAGTTVRWAGTIDLADVAAVPLPASGLLLLTGLAGLGVVGARRRSRQGGVSPRHELRAISATAA